MVAVSVLMPVYNREDVAARAIDSVLQQDFSDWELCIINDGSLDGTAGVLARYQDKRVRVQTWKKNKGEAVVRQGCVDMARAPVCCWQDSDDVSSKFRLGCALRAREAVEAAYMTTGYDVLRANDDRPGASPQISWTLGHSFPTGFFLRRLARGFDASYDVAFTDMKWEVEMILRTGRMSYLPLQLYYLGRDCKNRITRRWKDKAYAARYEENKTRFYREREDFFARMKAAGIERLPKVLSTGVLGEALRPLYDEIQGRTKGYKAGWGL